MLNSKKDVSTEQNERHRRILAAVLKLEGNRACADCRTRNPTWASVNLGVFVCLTCSGIHRSLGVHISQVRSCNLDTWLPKQVEFVRAMGNEKANAFWEAQLPDHFKRPPGGQPNAELASFIRAKYVDKRYAANDAPAPDINNYIGHPYVETAAPDAAAVQQAAGEAQGSATPPTSARSPAPAAVQADLLCLNPPPAPNSRNTSPAPAAAAAAAVDPFDFLAGSASNSPAPSAAAAPAAAASQQTLSLLDHDDWTDFASAPAHPAPAASVSSISSSATDPFAASTGSFAGSAPSAVVQSAAAAAADPFAAVGTSNAAAGPAATPAAVQLAAPAAADPFASISGHDLISNIQSMSVSSTNAPAVLGSAASASSSAGSFSTQPQQQQVQQVQQVQFQHSRSSSSGSGVGNKKTAEDILKLYDTPQPVLGVAAAPRDPYAFMPAQQGMEGAGRGAAGVGVGAGSMQQQQLRQQQPGALGAAFTHHPMSAMAPVAAAAAAGGFGQMSTGSSSPLGRLM